MNNFLGCDSGSILKLHRVPEVGSKVQIKLGEGIFSIIVSIHEPCPNQTHVAIHSRKIKGIAVSCAFWEASNIPKPSLQGFHHVFR